MSQGNSPQYNGELYKRSKTMKEENIEKLIEVWKVLEALTVSMDRMGSYWIGHSERTKLTSDALSEHLSPDMVGRIADARRSIMDVLASEAPNEIDHIEKLAEDEAAIGYWQYPAT
jgi:hypothetical protein